jgi:hypothetical protein
LAWVSEVAAVVIRQDYTDSVPYRIVLSTRHAARITDPRALRAAL